MDTNPVCTNPWCDRPVGRNRDGSVCMWCDFQHKQASCDDVTELNEYGSVSCFER